MPLTYPIEGQRIQYVGERLQPLWNSNRTGEVKELMMAVGNKYQKLREECDKLDKSINLIRDRVGMPHLTTNPDADPNAVNYGYTVAPLLYEIRRERRIELVGEGFRFNDIIRWKAGKLIEGVKTIRGMKLTDELRSQYADPSSLNNIAVDDDYYIIVYPSIATTRKWNDKSYLYPLPTDEKDRCHYEQNPGWN